MADDHDIEKQLRAYADQRRKEAGAPFTMHPATRRMLQDEAARVHGKKESGSAERTSLFAALWFRVAVSVCAVAVLAVAVFAPVLSKSKSRAMRLAGKQESDKMETASFDRSRTLAPAREAAPAPGASPATLAYKVDARKDTAGPAEETAKDNSAAQPLVAAATNSIIPGTAIVTPVLALNPPAPQQNFYFRNESASAATGVAAGHGPGDKLGGTDLEKSLDRRSKTAAEKIPLDSFQVEQTGDQIRITDSDGSVYNGHLTAIGAETPAGPAGGVLAALPPAPAMETETPRQLPALEDRKPAIANVVQQQNQNFQFNAIGTNLSLNQKIVINGEFVAATNPAMASGGAMPGGLLNGHATTNGSLLLFNGRITGRAVLGNGQEIQLNAAPVSP
jgi:hypothetical protein